MQHAWTGYRTYAWGFNELKPLTKTFHSAGIFGTGRHMGATIVDSLDTLFIMDLKEEYESGSRWVLENIINRANFLTVRLAKSTCSADNFELIKRSFA